MALRLLMVLTVAAVSVEDLPLIDPDTTVLQVSSHNKKGINGDAGFYLYQEEGGEGLSGWCIVDDGATPAYTTRRVHSGRGAMVHTVTLDGRPSRWRSVVKPLSAGLNMSDCSRLSLWVWPTHADGGADYAVRIDSGESCAEIRIPDLKRGEWNHVVLDISNVPRSGVRAFWLLFHLDWGAKDGIQFFVDDIAFLRPDGEEHVVDDFEHGPSLAVCFDALGPGCLRNFWGLGGYDMKIEVDGETIVDSPQHEFFQGRVLGFPSPLVFKGLVATGPWKCQAHWSFVPIAFRKRCRILTSNPRPMFHYIYERYRTPDKAREWEPDQDLEPLVRLWKVRGSEPKPWTDLRVREGELSLAPGEKADFLRLDSPGAIASIKLSFSPLTDELLQQLRLRIYWDGEEEPSVDSPAGIFFGAGVHWQDIPSLLMGVKGDWGYCYFPMPFWKSARFRIENNSQRTVEAVRFKVTWTGHTYPQGRAGYFRTWFNRVKETTLGRDYLFLQVPGQGHFVGVVHTMIGGHYCEGDERFHVDGSRSPSFYGTGTEDYYLAACWPNMDYHSPFHGCVGDVAKQAEDSKGKTFRDFRACYYRMHLDAPVRFRSGISCGIEHGGTNDTKSSYTSLAYYYSIDRLGLIWSDCLQIGSAESEKAHALSAGKQLRRSELTDCFEGDEDDIEYTFRGIATAEPLKVTLTIDPQNRGVRLRRVYDQRTGRQWADVLVDGRPAGSWYDPDSNEYKRLAESEFEIAPELTMGRKRITVEFRPRRQHPAWTVMELYALSHLDHGPDVMSHRLELTPCLP